MPEGPEVETIRLGLAQRLAGQMIVRVDGLDIRHVAGVGVAGVRRRGKVLVWDLSNGWSLLFHLKMTGQMVLVQADGERMAGGHPSASMAAGLPDRSTRMTFEFASGDRLYFNDQRKFGWVKVVPTAEVELDSLVARMGSEVLAPEFTAAYLATQLARHARAPVKAVILDQSVVAGVGNIYADESLHLARLHPARLAGSLKPAEVKRLQVSLREIMALGMEHGGTSFAHYVNALGGKGDYLAIARVFRRQGQPCRVHPDTLVQKIRVAGRGTHICPKCQRLPR
jgi:formamidopyrimidine-DNA glycosylase